MKESEIGRRKRDEKRGRKEEVRKWRGEGKGVGET